MEFSRELGVTKCESSVEFSDISLYIRRIIEFYSAVEINRSLWLPERCKDFYVATVIHVNLGITNPISASAVQIYKKYFNSRTTKREINNYLNAISKLGWLDYDKDGKHVKIVPMFHGIGNKNDSFEFKIKLTCDEVDRQDNDGDTG